MLSVETATPDGQARSQLLQFEQKSRESSVSSSEKCMRPCAGATSFGPRYSFAAAMTGQFDMHEVQERQWSPV